jgi:hypothetical protein
MTTPDTPEHVALAEELLARIVPDPDLFLGVRLSFLTWEHEVSLVEVEPGGRVIRPFAAELIERSDAYAALEHLLEQGSLRSVGIRGEFGELYKEDPLRPVAPAVERSKDRCLAHFEDEPCPTCASYKAAGL